jgi:hypothetical protein
MIHFDIKKLGRFDKVGRRKMRLKVPGDTPRSGAISCEAVSHGVARYMAGSNAEALKKLLLGHIHDAPADGIHKSTLMKRRGVGKATAFEFDSAIQWLERSGQISNVGKSYGRGGRGRSGEKYVATELMRIAA